MYFLQNYAIIKRVNALIERIRKEPSPRLHTGTYTIMIKRIFAVLMLVCLLIPFAGILTPPAHAAAKITDTVNATLFIRDTNGSGYHWDNKYDVLTLTDLYIDTSAEYGLKVPAGATVILEGDNYIKASRAALALAGTATFKGDGSLTIISDDIGIYCYSTDKTSIIRILDGTYIVTAGGSGITSTHTAISFVNGEWQISAGDFAMDCKELKLYGGKMEAVGEIHASGVLDIQAIDLRVTAKTAALTSDKTLKFTDVSVRAGESADTLAAKESYNGERCVVLQSTRSHAGKSIFFGENVPKIADYLLLLGCLALVGAGIVIPLIRARRKAKLALAKAEIARAEKNN